MLRLDSTVRLIERTYGGNSRQRRIAKRCLKRSIAYTELVRDVYAHMLKLNEDQIKSLIYGKWTFKSLLSR